MEVGKGRSFGKPQKVAGDGRRSRCEIVKVGFCSMEMPPVEIERKGVWLSQEGA